MTAELGTWAGAIGAAIHGAEGGDGRDRRGVRGRRTGRWPAVTEAAYQPQYRQIEQALRERIAALRPGERLPSDAELCAEFGVSRMTARNAMQRLAEDGLVARQPGRGSFVAAPPAHRRANRLMTFTQEMLRRGRAPSSRLLTRVIRPSTTAEAASLEIPPRQPIVHLRRLRCADEEPIAIESTVLLGLVRRRRDDGRPGPRLAPRDARPGRHRAPARDGHDRRGRRDGRGCPPARRSGPATRCSSSGGSSATTTAAGSRRPNRATRPTATPSTIAFDVEAPDRGDDGLERMSREVDGVRGRLVLDDRVEPGRIAIEDGWIADRSSRSSRSTAERTDHGAPATEELPYIAPGFVDVHVHGGGGHDAMGGADALDGMARAPAAARRDLVPADGRDRAAAGPRRVRRDGPRLAARRARPTARSRSGSTSRGRSSPRPARAPTTRRSSGRRPTSPARPRAAPRRACA